MITGKGLQKLGFVSGVDYSLEDHSDGNGVQLTWLSASPQPTVAEIEAAQVQWKSDYDADQSANETNTASAKVKLQGLGLTLDEVKSAFGI
tara:strand:- start:18 stop:290 length:273 start_codon:yes stop_codon:yes gene_type:complete